MKLTLLPRKRGERRCGKKGRTKGEGKDEREGNERVKKKVKKSLNLCD